MKTSWVPLSFVIIGLVAASAMLGSVGIEAEAHPAVAASRGELPIVLIEALYHDTYESREPDEAFRLLNVSSTPAGIGGWSVTDGEGTVMLPQGVTLARGQAIWCSKQAAAFTRQFGFKPDFELDDTDPDVPQMSGSWPRFANAGDECLLVDDGDDLVDALVYRDGDISVQGWSGPALQPWTPSTTFAAEGQILYRKRDQATGLPVPDTDTADDWAQDPGDHIDGRRVLYPGWDLDAFFFTQRLTETAILTVAIAPDNLFDAVANLLTSAQESIQIESYSFRSRELADVLLDRLNNGVSITLLLEGAPAFGGVTDQEKWIVRRLHDNGAQVLFMINDSANQVHDRYKNQHAKLMIVDGTTVLVGSENLSYPSMPADGKGNGTAGRRGVYLITDAPGVAARARAIFAADADPTRHLDVASCDTVPDLCTAPAGFEPAPTPDWMTYTVQFPTPQTWQGTFGLEVIQSPENSLRTRDGLLGLLDRAGPGDTILVEQLTERLHWGPSQGTPESDPSPRLAAYLDAARRGAAVRILLDEYLDESGDNAETVGYLQAIARAEGLDLKARLANPAFLGLHNKMILAHIGGRGYVHVGSINGNEASFKVNREVALQVQSSGAYEYLKSVFEYDWRGATPPVYLPLLASQHEVPRPAGHLLISEVYYGVAPVQEWVEIYNPTNQVVALSPYKLGDAVHDDDYEGTYQFPPGASIQPDQVLVVAVTTSGFQKGFPGRKPDYEILGTDAQVPNMLDYPARGEGDWGLNNSGDEVLLLDGKDRAVDVLVYGQGFFSGVVPHPGVAYGHSLERAPAWLDTDDCTMDFRDWPYPSPGHLPTHRSGQ